jgi:hypothetical protein
MSRCVPAPTLVQMLEEATRLWPKRRRTSDGICSSPDHRKQSPGSDHDVGNAGDLSHDPANGCDAHHLADLLIKARDPRVKYVISDGRIWNPSRDKPGVWRPYAGANPHTLHIHVSIHTHARNSTASWWLPLLKPLAAPPEDDMTPEQATQLAEVLRLVKQTNHPAAHPEGNLAKVVRMVRDLQRDVAEIRAELAKRD